MTQFLYQPPHFGSRGSNFLRDLGAADNDSGIAHQEADDASQASIGLLGRNTPGSFTFWLRLDGGNYKAVVGKTVVGRWSLVVGD